MKQTAVYRDLPAGKSAFLFGLDNVLYPRKDYDLQIFYLFSNLLEYTERSIPARELLEFFKECYAQTGEIGIFDKAQARFSIPEKYRKAFEHTCAQGRLPLKLLLFKEVLELVQAIVRDEKPLGLLTRGPIDIQWNKIKQTEWNGLDRKIKIYFYDELIERYPEDPLGFVEQDMQVSRANMLYFGSGRENRAWTEQLGLDYQDIRLFISNIE